MARVLTERTAAAAPRLTGLLDNWRQIVATGNLPRDRAIDPVSRWLLITRACVFSMTLTSALIGGLLAAATAPVFAWRYFALAVLGLLVAHAGNNMINDYFDTVGGVDTAEYTRALYAPHPLLSGLISKAGLRAAIFTCNLADVVIGLILLRARGWPVAAFALAGLFVSVFYVAPPLKLKHHGLGEPGVFLVWGPLMTGGTYFVTAGSIPAWVWLASLPYALSVTTVLIGKHIDKYEQDGARGIHTLPVLLGKNVSLRLNQGLMVGFYAAVAALVVSGKVGVGVLLVAAAIPRLRQVLKAYGEPKPAAPPPGYRVWPLWFVSLAFYHGRLAGGLFVLGLVLNALLAELLLLAGRRLEPVERLVEADAPGDAAPLVHQRARHDLPALSLGAEAVRRRHPDVGHEDLVELGTPVELPDRADLDAAAAQVHQEDGETAPLGSVGRRADEDEEPVGDVGERRPDLLTVHHVVFAVAHGARLGCRHVGPRRRLRVAGRPDLVRGENGGNEALLLGAGPVADDRRADPPDGHRVHHLRGARAGELLIEDRLLHRREPGAAVLLRPGGAEKARGVKLPLPGAHRRQVALPARLREVLGEPRAHAGAEGLLGGAVGKIHRPPPAAILAERRRPSPPGLWAERTAVRWLASSCPPVNLIRGGGNVLCSNPSRRRDGGRPTRPRWRFPGT